MEPTIKSRDNALVKRARAVRDSRSQEFIFIEGVRLCEEAIQSGIEVTDCFVTSGSLVDQRITSLRHRLGSGDDLVRLVSDSVFESIADTATPQGIILIGTRPLNPQQLVLETDQALLVVMHRVSQPVNAGAIIRTAEAAGASALIATAGTADIFSTKALRGAMGSSFRLKTWTDIEFAAAIAWCKANRLHTVCADAAGETDYTEFDWTRPAALIVGSEGAGLSQAELAVADHRVRIPMRPPVESLNVGAATAVLLFEAARQRHTR